MLALEYEGWHGNPVDQGGKVDQGVVDALTSIPKTQILRGRKRGKGGEEVIPEVSGTVEQGAVESDEYDSDGGNMALGSSCITSGSEEDTDEDGKETKKLRLESDEESSDEIDPDNYVFEDQEVADVAPVTEDTRKEGKALSSGDVGAFSHGNISNGEEVTE